MYPGNELNFIGVKCGSLGALDGKYCPGKGYPMGMNEINTYEHYEQIKHSFSHLFIELLLTKTNNLIISFE